MPTKTASRPTPRTSQSHTPSHSQSHRSSKPSTTPKSPPPRVASSVGQPLPPHLRTPAVQDARTPSPNYFGLQVEPEKDMRDSGLGPNNWSPPTSSILSFDAASPKHLPLDSNPEFEAFRRQTEEHHGFNLSHGSLSHFASTPSAVPRPRPDRRPTRTDTQQHSPKSKPRSRDGTPDRMDLDRQQSFSRGAMKEPSFFDIPRAQSPERMNSPKLVPRNMLSQLDDRHPRLSLPQNKADPPSPHIRQAQKSIQHRADTLPSTFEDGPVMGSVSQVRDMIVSVPAPQFLLLDLRVAPQFSLSRIVGALNLCIPTTLLKRPSFNLQKLKETFTNEAEKARFAQWNQAKYIIVYDAFSSEKKDATSALNTLKKFSTEGWKGSSYIIRGGFQEFSKAYPKLIDNSSRSAQEMQSSKISLSLGTAAPDVAPVAGGCVMPATKSAANPFFSNIRQNQDLIGGVGQMDIKIPEDLTQDALSVVPNWLCKASEKEDRGKKVSDKFLKLEQAEQARMTKALSSGVSYGTPNADANNVQIAGIEKGGKNRYNNIWPFEHARVRLQGRPDGACDYVNASHIRSSRSNKRYIASQGPLPATFEDFWSVVWDEDVRVIVMLTAESEGGQLKCHPYWSSQNYGPLKLKALSEKRVSLDTRKHRLSTDRRDSGRRRANTTQEQFRASTGSVESSPPAAQQPETPYAIVRKFTLAHSAHPFSPIREITQVHYSSWPDFGAPASPAQLLGLVELSNLMQRATSAPTQSTRSDEPEGEDVRPMLVHCSAGCGRTGTFCTVDSVIDMLKRQRKEQRSGVTPMEGATSSSTGDYMGKGRDRAVEVEGAWVFSQDEDLVEKTVEDFRGQRLSMVQSLRQFVLCYETVLEWIAQQNFAGAGSGSSSGSMGGERVGGRGRAGSDATGSERRRS